MNKEQQTAYDLLLDKLQHWAAAYVAPDGWDGYLECDEYPELHEAAKVLGLESPSAFANGVRFHIAIEKDGKMTNLLTLD